MWVILHLTVKVAQKQSNLTVYLILRGIRWLTFLKQRVSFVFQKLN